MTKKEQEIVVTGDEQIPTEVLADAIVRISQGFAKLLASGLNRRAMLVLLKDATGVSHDQIGRVLNALPLLSEFYTTPKGGKKR